MFLSYVFDHFNWFNYPTIFQVKPISHHRFIKEWIVSSPQLIPSDLTQRRMLITSSAGSSLRAETMESLLPLIQKQFGNFWKLIKELIITIFSIV